MEKPLKLSILGTGYIFPTHLKAALEAGFEVVGYDTGEDVVAILTPNYMHFPMIIQEINKRKIVLCEKPLVLKSAQIKTLSRYPRIYTVLQLRHHPEIEKIRSLIKPYNNKIKLEAMVYRPPEYYEKWKGSREQSGGILFNLGIHYFDLLLWLFGMPNYYEIDYFTEKTAYGKLKGRNYECEWKLSTEVDPDKCKRFIEINGQRIDLSYKGNLSEENLHKYVYEDLANGKGVTPYEQKDVVRLIEAIYHLLLKYTYIVDISDISKTELNFEKRTRYDIRKCEDEVYRADDILRFDELHKSSRPDRIINTQYIKRLYNSLQPNVNLYFTKSASAMISWDKDKAYYLLAGRDKRQKPDGSPARILFEAMKDMNKMGIKEFDLCGANKPNIVLFKKGFGGRLEKQTKTYIPQF